jgi:hypothetical protein
MVLLDNPYNYFAEVEQLAFVPSHLIPGIKSPPDKMLEARLFSYPDTHRHCLGVNYQLIPVNMPVIAKVNNYQKGGSMMVHANGGGAPITFPTVSLARRLVLTASGIVILCRATFCIVRLETRTIFCDVENSFTVRP